MDCYLVSVVEYDGDTVYKIINEDTWQYVKDGGPIPSAQRAILTMQIEDFAKPPKPGDWRAGTPADWRRDADDEIAALADDFANERYADQLRAGRVESDEFNGERFDGAYVSLTKAMNFIKKHGLILIDDFRAHAF